MSSDKLLLYIQNLIDSDISSLNLGLNRIKSAVQALNITLKCPVITVAGSNGKGSTVASIESIAIEHGVKVAAFTSPHLHAVNERFRLDKVPYSDDAIIQEADKLKKALDVNNLDVTFFEFITLLAFSLFSISAPELIILEVGLGGEFDATNVVDADVAVITSISLDHMHILGDSVEKIAVAKAGIIKPNKTLVCQVLDAKPKKVIIEKAEILNTKIIEIDKDYSCLRQKNNSWTYKDKHIEIKNLPLLRFPEQNAASAIQALQHAIQININASKVIDGLKKIYIPGRMEEFTINNKTIILDVAHNLASVTNLSASLPENKKIAAVFAQLETKDLSHNLTPMLPKISKWYVAKNHAKNSLEITPILEFLQKHMLEFEGYADVASAIQAGLESDNEIILVYGSFHTVADARDYLLRGEKNNEYY